MHRQTPPPRRHYKIDLSYVGVGADQSRRRPSRVSGSGTTNRPSSVTRDQWQSLAADLRSRVTRKATARDRSGHSASGRAKADMQRSCVVGQFITNVFAAGKIAKPAL
jgi:hypothetical protein